MTRSCVFFFCALCSFPYLVSAQIGNATLSGTVHDPSGAVVPGAPVTVTNTQTGVAHTTSTTASGLYVVPNLIPGAYTIDVAAPGFQKQQVSGIHLDIDQQATIDVTLQIGSSAQELTVTTAAQLLQTEDTSVGTVISTAQVESLPLNGRFFTQLLELSPGAAPAIRSPMFRSSDPNLAGRQRNGMPAFDVNGQNGAYTYFRIDGIENTEREFGGANIPVSVDAIQEVKIQTSNFSAEYGRGPAQVDVVVRSGTNQIHGTAFEFLRNDVLDASQWTFTGPHGKRLLKRNQFGGSIGGPIRKDELFWFFNYDGTREVYSAPRTVTVPTNEMRQGIFPAGELIFDPTTGLPFQNNTILANRFDDRSKKILALLPAPNLPGVAVFNKAGLPLPPTDNYLYSPKHRQTINQYNGRVDYNLSSKNSFFGRYTDGSNLLIGEGPLATNLQGSIVGFERADLGGRNLSTGWYHNFGPRTINESRFGFGSDPQLYAKGDTTDYASQLGLSQFLVPNAFKGLPHFRIGSVNLGSGDYRPLQVGEKNFQVAETFTLIRGNHNVRIGADIRRTILDTLNNENSTGRFYFNGAQTRDRRFPGTGTTFCPGGSDPAGCAAGDAMADFLLGYMSHFERGAPIPHFTKYFSTWAGYINDTWHIRPSLTLTLGLRYEYTTRFHTDPPTYAMPIIRNGEFTGKVAVAQNGSNLSPNVLPEALATIPGTVIGCSAAGLPSETCLISEKNDWQPRVGFAWQLNRKTVLRAAGGIFYGYLNGDADTEDGEAFPFILTRSTPTFTRPPSGTAPPPLLLSNPLALTSTDTPPLFASFPSRRLPSTYQWNLTLERELMADTTLSLAYVASLSRHLEDLTGYCCYYNIPQPIGVVLGPNQDQAPVDPRFSSIDLFEDENTAHYESFQTRLQRRFSHGLSFTASYTFAKNLGIINWLSDPRYPKLDKAPLDNDLRHNFVFAPIWQIPVGSGRAFLNRKGVVNQVLGGWQLTAILTKRSGYPFTPTLSGTDLLNANGFIGEDRPDRTCKGTVSNPSVFNWFDKSCFTVPVEPTTPGALLHQGNSGHNILRGPGAFGMDMGLSKSFPFTESARLEFRAEAFNVLNHPTFGLPNASIRAGGNSPPARITSTTSLPRIIQFAAKIYF